MVLLGHVKNGTIVLDEPLALPEGTVVSVAVAPAAEPTSQPAAESIWAAFAEVSGGIPAAELAPLPTDGAEQHDRYLRRHANEIP